MPNEAILKVLDFADFHGLLVIQQVCRRLRDMVAGSVRLQYTIALAAAGMRDGFSADPSITIAERLERLKAYEAAWADCNLIDCNLPEFTNYEDTTSGRDYVYGNILLAHPRADWTKLHVYQMPSPSLRGVAFRKWELSFDFGICSVSADVTQDLLVLISGPPPTQVRNIVWATAHANTLSTGKRHPDCGWSGEREMHTYFYGAAICGDYVAAEIVPLTKGVGPQYICIWNWKTGVAVAGSNLPDARGPGAAVSKLNFKFLDENHIILLADGLGLVGLGPEIHHTSVLCTPCTTPWQGQKKTRIFRYVVDFSYLPWRQYCMGHFFLRMALAGRQTQLGPRPLPSSQRHLAWNPCAFEHDKTEPFVLRSRSGALAPSVLCQRNTVCDWGPGHVHVWEKGPTLYPGSIYGMKAVTCTDGLIISDYHPQRVARAQSGPRLAHRTVVLSNAASAGGVFTPPRIITRKELPQDEWDDVIDLKVFEECVMMRMVRMDVESTSHLPLLREC